MEAKAIKETPKVQFLPVHLSISFHTLEELDAFYTLMNHATLCDFLRDAGGIEPNDIRDPIRGYINHTNCNALLTTLNKVLDR